MEKKSITSTEIQEDDSPMKEGLTKAYQVWYGYPFHRPWLYFMYLFVAYLVNLNITSKNDSLAKK